MRQSSSTRSASSIRHAGLRQFTSALPRPRQLAAVLLTTHALAMAVVFAASKTIQAASVIYVDSRATTCGDGQSWETAFKYLQDALHFVSNNGGPCFEIWVAAGTYQPDHNCQYPSGYRDRGAAFNLSNIGALRGGFAGNEDPATFDLASRDFVANQTILSGDLAGDDGPSFANNGENSYHVVAAYGVSSTTILDGFTVSGGNANQTSSGNYYGAGMHNTGSPAVVNCTFSGNSSLAGGGLYSSGNPNITNCTFSGNSAPNGGGGMCNDDGSPTLTNCIFENNISSGERRAGGGMNSWGGTVTLARCSFIGNKATGGFADGGGLYINSGVNKVIACSFIGNTSQYTGGGLCIDYGSTTLTNCEFIGNWSNDGGGVYVYGNATWPCTLTLTNCVFAGNKGPEGTAFTIDGATLTARNCIVWGNKGQQIRKRNNGSISLTHSCVEGGWAGDGNIDIDPMFASFAGGDLRLSAGSPCIDAGNNALVPADILTDLTGFARFFDDPNVADCQWFPGACGTAPIVDMGAYESNGLYPPAITQQPAEQTLCEGGTATFIVTAIGTGSLSYQWQKDGVNLADDTKYSGVTTNTLNVIATISADKGGYRCVVTDSNGSTQTGEATLTVKPSTVITQQPVNTTGTPATFTITATGEGTLAYQWQKNGVNITDSTHYAGTTTPTLTIAYCACGDTNIYRCVVTGGCTVAISDPATLTCQPGDFDGDSDVDQEDFGALQTCLTANVSASPACESMDISANGTIDGQDVAKFIGCLSGPNVPTNPNCGN